MQRLQMLAMSQTRQQRLTMMLTLCGVGSLGIFLLLTVRYPLERFVLFPLADLGSLSHYAPAAASFFGISMLLLLVFYPGAYWAIRRAVTFAEGLSERAAQIIVIFPILAMLTLLHLYPLTSLSVINQAIQVRVLTVHHANPLLTTAASFPGDPFTAYDDTQNLPSPYGPFWIILSAGPTLLAGNNLLALVLLEKMVPLVFTLGCQRLVWLIASRIAPHRRWQALLLYSWNPLLLFEVAGNGHNDAVLLFFVLLAFYFLIVGPRWLTLPALGLALLINSLALILLPLCVVALWRTAQGMRKNLRALLVGGTLALVLLGCALLPFGGLKALPALLQPFGQYALSLPALLYNLLQPFYNAALADQVVKILAGGSFLCCALVIIYRLARHNRFEITSEYSAGPEALLAAGYEVIFWFFVLAALAFTPAMLLWLIPIGALVPSPTLWARTTVMTACGLLSPLLLIFVSNGALVTGALSPITVQFLVVISLFGPALTARALEALYQRRRLLATLAAREAELHQLQYQLSGIQGESARPPNTSPAS